MLYFKADQMKKDTELEPQNFKPLCDFVVAELNDPAQKRPHTFKIIFAKDGAITREMLLSAPSEKDKDEWILAFRAHQIDMFEKRSKYFDAKLKTLGVLVPSASQLVAQGEGALNSEYNGKHEEQKAEDTGEMPRATFHYK
jgi:hypothetical protein